MRERIGGATGENEPEPGEMNPDLAINPGEVAPLDVADDDVAAALADLERRAYAVEAALIGHDGIPQLRETVQELRGAGLNWLGITDDAGRPVAAIGYSWDGPVLDIERLVVEPGHFRRGLAGRLVASLPPAEVTVVSTGRANAPARALYERHGFRHVADVEAVPGLWVSRLRRESQTSA
jgi:ribosomal protein S18 acetylase RimI-like enzyme